MGIVIRDIIESKEIELKDLAHKIVVFDTFNLLYQFITTIRSYDGGMLSNSKGQTTSHLVGLFSRIPKLLELGVKPVFVFDGKPPELKQEEIARRKGVKVEAQKAYEEALATEDVVGMKKFASRTARLTPQMVDEAKELLGYLGLPVIQAPSEGEAQAAHVVKNGDAYAVISQDFDTLLHGAPLLLRNVSLSGKRKKTGKIGYTTIKPEIISLSHVLNTLGIDNDQLIVVAILVGTDYNPGGVKGLGQKKALQLVKKHGKDFEALFEEVDTDFAWKDIFYLIKQLDVTDDYVLEWKEINVEKLKEMLVGTFEFAEERVAKTLEKLQQEKPSQKGLGDFL